MSALVAYLALGSIDPVTRAFTEASFSGYARQAIAFDLDTPQAGGAIETGGDVLRNTNEPTFAAPAGLDWPSFNGAALFVGQSGGAAQMTFSLGGLSGIHARGTSRIFRAGRLVLRVNSGAVESALGGRVVMPGMPSVIGGALSIGATALGGTLLAITGAPPSGKVGTAYTFTPTVTGGSGTKTFALTGALPSGLSFSTSTGAITGTPLAAGTTANLNIAVTDANGSVSLGAFSLLVSP